MAGAPVYIVHLSCNDALEKVREARDRGLPVYAETCPQYLYLSIENFRRAGALKGQKYVFTPPLREKWHQEKLWKRNLKRTICRWFPTDHCPFCYKEQKELGRDDFTKIPNGGPGIEAPHEPGLFRWRCQESIQRESLCGARVHRSGKLFGSIRGKAQLPRAVMPISWFSTRSQTHH